MAVIVFLAFSLLLQGALGELLCDDLPVTMCSFSIATSGKRCSLETGDVPGVLECKTSEVVVNNLHEHIETDECINACGVDRTVIGISSDALLEPEFVTKICSKECLNNCPNIVDLYSNLALAEGVFLPGMCRAQRKKGPSKAAAASTQMIRSSGVAPATVSLASSVAAGPSSSVGAPAPSAA